MGLENPVWLSFHPLIKQFPEVLTGISPLHVSVAGKGESQICYPGFSQAYSAASALLFQIPAKIKARKGKLSLWASTTPQLLHARKRHGCAGRRGAAACPSESHGWPCSAAEPQPETPQLRERPGAGHIHRHQKTSSCTLCRCIYCTSAVLPSRCSWGEQACRQN